MGGSDVRHIQLHFQCLEDEQCEEACDEVGDYAVVSAQIYRSALELCLECAEHVLDFPPLRVCAYDFNGSLVFEIGAYGVEAVEACFFFDCFKVKSVGGVFGYFGTVGEVRFGNEPRCIIGRFFLTAGCAVIYRLDGAVNLLLSQRALIQGVLFRVCDDEPLLKVILVYPTFLIENSVADLCGFVGKESHRIVLSADVPPLGAERPLLQMRRYLLVFK